MLIDHLEIANIDVILNSTASGEAIAMLAGFKLSLNAYLKDLVVSPVEPWPMCFPLARSSRIW